MDRPDRRNIGHAADRFCIRLFSYAIRCDRVSGPNCEIQGLHLSPHRNRCFPRSASMLMIMKGPRHHSLLAAYAKSHLFSSGFQTQGDTPVLDAPPD